MISTDSTLQIRFTRWRNRVYNKLTILFRKCERSQLSQICSQSVNIRTESESLAEVGRRLSLEKSCGAARLCCLFLNLKIKTLFTKRTRDIGEKVGGSVTYQILRGVTGKDGRGGEAESQRRRRGRKQLQSALKKLFLQQSSISLHISKCLSCLTMSLFRWPVIPIYPNVSMTNTVVVMITKFVHHYQWEDHHFIFRVSWFSYLNMRWEISWELSLVTFLHQLDLLKFLFLWLTQPFET